MSIVRSPRPESHFGVYSNDIVRDKRLSYKARGILLELLSRPDNWRVSAEMLAAEGPDGRDSIMAGLKELRDLGYIVTNRIQNEKGQWTTESVVFDNPQQPKTGFPSSVKPSSGEPSSANPVVIEEPIKNNRERRATNPDGLAIKQLMAIYFENFTGDLEPARGQTAGQLEQALKEIGYEKLEPLVRRVALDGQTVSRNTLIYAAKSLTPKPVQATYTPPQIQESDLINKEAVPMPANFKDMVLKGIGASLTDE
jgi:hypothetical protein